MTQAWFEIGGSFAMPPFRFLYSFHPAVAASALWILSLWQLLFALFRTMPVGTAHIDYSVRYQVGRGPDGRAFGAEVRWDTIASRGGLEFWKVSFTEALMTLSSPCCWASIRGMAFLYASSQIDATSGGLRGFSHKLRSLRQLRLLMRDAQAWALLDMFFKT